MSHSGEGRCLVGTVRARAQSENNTSKGRAKRIMSVQCHVREVLRFTSNAGGPPTDCLESARKGQETARARSLPDHLYLHEILDKYCSLCLIIGHSGRFRGPSGVHLPPQISECEVERQS